MTYYKLTTEEEDILKNGLSFGVPPRNVSKSDVFTSFEMINRFFSQNLTDVNNKGMISAELTKMANSYVSNYKPSKSTLKKHGILKRLRNNKNIVITKPDKGNAVVIIDRDVYDKCLLEILSDETKFKVLEKDPTITRETSLQNKLRPLKKKGFLSEANYEKIYPTGSVPARIYGLPKIHKKYATVPSFRPIVSSLGTFNYNLAVFLGELLSDVIPTEHSCVDTFTFINELKQANITDKFITSFDVVSLFTHIPLEETINLAVDKIFNKNPELKITKKELKELFIFATSKTNFLFKDTVYDQIDGVTMGSPLAPY